MSYRDFSKPYTEKELQEQRQMFRALPTFKEACINSSDVPALILGMRWQRTPEQVFAYQEYVNTAMGGTLTEESFVDIIQGLQRTSNFVRVLAVDADKDKDGLISADEFEQILKVLVVSDPRLTGKSYADFVAEADTNKDGAVDIEECVAWILEHAPNSRASSVERD